MPNIGGPDRRCKLLSNVSKCILLYAAPIYSTAAAVMSYRSQGITVYHRRVLRVAQIIRTVSHDAVCIVSLKMPNQLVAE